MIQKYRVDLCSDLDTEGNAVLLSDHLAALKHEEDIATGCSLRVTQLEAAVKDFENSDAGMLRAVNEGLVEESKILVEQIAVLTAELQELHDKEEFCKDALKGEKEAEHEPI